MVVAPLVVAGLAAVAFAAGFVDAVAGGGGLLQVPALFGLCPGVPAAQLLGTNKASSIAGTSVATIRFARAGKLPVRLAAPTALASLPASFLGARLVQVVDPSVLRPLVLGLCVAVLVVTLRARPDADAPAGVAPTRARAIALGVTLGFYDGFFGPGTGTFLVFGFHRLLGLDLVRSSAAAKLVNLTTNVAALAAFASRGDVLLEVALPMAAANVAGGYLGASVALARGVRAVRAGVVVAVVLLLAKVAYDLLVA